MSKLKHKIIIGVLLACALAVGTVPAGVSANANSAIKIWHGTSSSGAIIADENCPVEVENELLTFDINGFPQQYYGEAELYTYDAKVTAHYALYNPADYGVDVSLAFPFGRLPEYANNFTDDSATFKITADGEECKGSFALLLPTESSIQRTICQSLRTDIRRTSFTIRKCP